jgi:hypothetical protein
METTTIIEPIVQELLYEFGGIYTTHITDTETGKSINYSGSLLTRQEIVNFTKQYMPLHAPLPIYNRV